MEPEANKVVTLDLFVTNPWVTAVIQRRWIVYSPKASKHVAEGGFCDAVSSLSRPCSLCLNLALIIVGCDAIPPRSRRGNQTLSISYSLSS